MKLSPQPELFDIKAAAGGKAEPSLLDLAPVVHELSFSWFKVCLQAPKKQASELPDNSGIFPPQCGQQKVSRHQQASKNKTRCKWLVLPNNQTIFQTEETSEHWYLNEMEWQVQA